VGYAVEMYLDAEAERRVKHLWHTHMDEGVGSVLVDIGSRPHISLTVLEDAHPDELHELRGQLECLARELPPIDLSLAAVGTYPTAEGVVFLVPSVSAQLVRAHQVVHQRLSAIGMSSSLYYQPGFWIPHCTVATDLKPDMLPLAMEICRKSSVFGRARISSIGLVSFRPVRELYTFPLTDEQRQAE
jgi:2'-5' RNA ligase